MHSEELSAQRVEGSHLKGSRFRFSNEFVQSFAHFVGSLVSECNGAYRLRRYPMCQNQLSDSGRQNLEM